MSKAYRRGPPDYIAENPYYINGGAVHEEQADETEDESGWVEPDYDDEWDFEKEEEWTDEDWADVEIDYDEIDFDNFDFDFEEDFGFYDLADERDDETLFDEDSDEWDMYDENDEDWSRPSEEHEDFDFDTWEEDVDFENDESWTDDGTWTDDYGTEYHSYRHEADGTEGSVGYTVTEHTDEWGTSYYETQYDDGSYFSSSWNEDEGWSDWYGEDADGVWSSEYVGADGYWSMNTYDPMTGRSVYESGDPQGNYWREVMEEDGRWVTESHAPDGSKEISRYNTDGSSVTETTLADGTVHVVARDWEGNETTEEREVADDGSEVLVYDWEEDGRQFSERWYPDGSAEITITNRDGSYDVQHMGADGSMRSEAYDASGAMIFAEDISYYQLADGTFVMEKERDDGSREEHYFREDGAASAIHFDAAGEVVFEEFMNDDGSSTRRMREGAWHIYETTDAWGETTIERWNEDTGENAYEYADIYGNWISESFDTESGEMTRRVYDEQGNVYVERYDAAGELIGEVQREDREGWSVSEVIDNNDGTWTEMKERCEPGAEAETEVCINSMQTWNSEYCEGTCAQSTVVVTDADGNEIDTFDTTHEGYRIDS